MKITIQRVKQACVEVDSKIVGKIDQGILVLLGVTHDDKESDADWLINKLINLRIFRSEESHFDKSLEEIKGGLLVISQFTLYGSCKKGRRPDFNDAAKPEPAKALYEYFVEKCRENGIKTETGIFGADMKVTLTNDGPVTLTIDSPQA